ncbi:GNAT family N-acetyltransferase [Mucilaginibacter antarcticus]|uniref:GNAT family N-acetyltransferase n=1 Tax=Mucilaginibacter antarcticus TaxID=1855725 RepID=UPI00363E1342
MTEFDKDANYILEDDKVLLRPLQADDLQHFIPFALNEPDTWQYSLKSAAGEEAMRTYVNEAVTARQAGKEYAFIVYDKTTGQYAGCTRYYDIQPAYKTLQLGYTWYGETFRERDLTSVANSYYYYSHSKIWVWRELSLGPTIRTNAV